MLRSRVLALSCSSRIFHTFIYYWFKIFLFKYSDFINTVCCCHLSALLFRQVCNLCFLPLVPPGVLVPVLLPPADHPLRHHPHLLRLQALHDPEVVEDGPSVRAHPLLYLPLGVRAVPAVHNVVEVVHNLTRAGADIHQARIECWRKRVMRCSVPHSYESVLSQSVSSIRDNFDGGIVDLRCLACPPNYQLFLLTSVTLDDSSENKHNARLIIKIWRYFLSLFRLLLIITA